MMGKPKLLRKEVRQSISNGNNPRNPSSNQGKQSVVGSSSLSTSSRQRRRQSYNLVRTEPDLVASVQCDSEWKNPFKCVACGKRFGWRLERDSHELVCLDQISGQALLEMKTDSNYLPRENQTAKKPEREDAGYEEDDYEKYVNIVDANDNFEDLGAEVEIASESKSKQTDMEQKLENASSVSTEANYDKSYFDPRIQANLPSSHPKGLRLNGEPVSFDKSGIIGDKPALTKPSSTSHNRIFLSEFSKFTHPGTSSISSDTMEELLDFRLDQADHFEVAGLLSSLNQMRLENEQMEKSVENLLSRKQQLLATRQRLLSLNSSSFDISTLDDQSHDNSSQLSTVRPSQLSPASPSQLSPASPSQLSPARTSQLSAVKPSKLSAVKPSQLSPASPSQLSPARPSQLSPASPSQLSPASPSQLSAVKPSKLSAVKPSQLSAVKPSKVSAATQSQLSAATPSQLLGDTPSPVSVPSLKASDEAGLKADSLLEGAPSTEECQESPKRQKIPVIVNFFNPRHTMRRAGKRNLSIKYGVDDGCFRCGESGHFSRECPRGGGSGGMGGGRGMGSRGRPKW